jgi:hypothetical protein
MHPDQTPSWQDGKAEDVSVAHRGPGRGNPWLLPLLITGALLAVLCCVAAVIFLVRG